MKFVIPCIISCLILLIAASFISKQDDWQVLLDKNLSQWDIYLSYRHAFDLHRRNSEK